MTNELHGQRRRPSISQERLIINNILSINDPAREDFSTEANEMKNMFLENSAG